MVVVIAQFWYFLSYTVLVVCVENFLHLLPETFLPFEDCPRKRQSSVDFASNMCCEKVMHWKYKILHAVHGKHAGSELLLCHHIWHDICLACSASYGTTLQIRTRNASKNCRAVDLHSRSLLIYTSIEERRHGTGYVHESCDEETEHLPFAETASRQRWKKMWAKSSTLSKGLSYTTWTPIRFLRGHSSSLPITDPLATILTGMDCCFLYLKGSRYNRKVQSLRLVLASPVAATSKKIPFYVPSR